MRTLVDIPKNDLSLLNRISEHQGLSRAEIIRQAIKAYLEPHKKAEKVDAFGLWADRPVDGLEYQEKIRSEW